MNKDIISYNREIDGLGKELEKLKLLEFLEFGRFFELAMTTQYFEITIGLILVHVELYSIYRSIARKEKSDFEKSE